MNCFQNFISVFWSTHGGKLLVIKHLSLCLTSVNAFDIADESATEGVGTSCPCLAVVQMLTWQHTAKLGKPEGAPPLFSSLAIRYLKCCKTVWVWVCEMKTVELLSASKRWIIRVQKDKEALWVQKLFQLSYNGKRERQRFSICWGSETAELETQVREHVSGKSLHRWQYCVMKTILC